MGRQAGQQHLAQLEQRLGHRAAQGLEQAEAEARRRVAEREGELLEGRMREREAAAEEADELRRTVRHPPSPPPGPGPMQCSA